jgi:hypothetical protein
VNGSGGWGSYEYSLDQADWSNATGQFEDLAAQQYTVTVRDAGGCTEDVSVEIEEPETALAITEDESSHADNPCYGESAGVFQVTGSGGQGSYEYSLDQADWSNTTGQFENLAAQQYTVTVRDAGGCTEDASIDIEEPEELQIASATVEETTIIVSGSGGTQPYSYSLDNSTWQESGTFSDLTNGDYTVYLTDANNCGPDTSSTLTVASRSSRIDDVSGDVNKIYPNPSNGLFNLSLAKVSSGEVDIEVYTLSGTKIYEEVQYLYAGETQTLELDITSVPQGVYLLKINGTYLNQKLIIE